MIWKIDTDELNAASEQIIANLQEESLCVYCFIHDQWAAGSVVENKLFQFIFRSFYRIDGAGLTDEFKSNFFQILENNRNKKPDIENICKILYDIKNRKGQSSLQFSFVSKLANTVDPSLPIYDSEVAKVYGYKPPPSSRPVCERITNYLGFYRFLDSDYGAILKRNSLGRLFDEFDNRYPQYKQKIDPKKKLDFIIWSAGKLREK